MFKLYGMGDSGHLEIFLNELNSNPKFNVSLEEKFHYDAEKKREKITMSVNVQKVKPTTISLHAQNGEKIDIDFLKCMDVEMDGTRFISGYTYDIWG